MAALDPIVILSAARTGKKLLVEDSPVANWIATMSWES
jgi:hypothetical protein